MIPEARECPYVRAKSKGNCTTVAVFVVEGLPGLWRQVSREGRQGIKGGDGRVVAHVGSDKLIELVRDVSFEDWLSQMASLEVVPANSDGEPVMA